MKKIFILLTILTIITGCNKQPKKQKPDPNQNTPNIKEPEKEYPKADIYSDDNSIKVGLYEKNKIVKSYSTSLSNFKDIAVFDIYYTNDETLDNTNQKDKYLKYYNQYENIENYKTGFHFSFEADGKKIEHLALDPKSKHAMGPYLYIYIYDDINQKPGTYYNHLEPEDMKENTIFSSIKLFFAQEGTKITSPITMTVFTYDSDDDFTEDKHYRGNSSYTIEIETKQ